VIDVVSALVEKRADAGLDHIHASLDAGSDPRQFARQIVDYLRDLLLIRMGNATQVNATQEVMVVMGQHSQKFQTPELLQSLRIFNVAASDARNPWQPSLPLEMAFVEAMNASEAGPTGPAASGAATAERPSGATRREDRPAQRPASPGRSETTAGAAPPAPPQTASEPAQDELPAADPQLNKRLSDAWLQILNQVRQENNAAYGAFNSATAKSLRGNTLTVSFASDVIRSKVDRPEITALLKKALQNVLGREVEVVFRVDTARRDSVPPGVDENGVVATAVRDLGGELVDIN
jgi:DNA polymerase-3 subunit gamma/tau